MRIGTRAIGPSEPAYVIAELGVNHDGDVARALELVDAAQEAGADAIKLQYFRADLLLSDAARPADYQRRAGEEDPRAMLRRLELTPEEVARVIDRAHDRGLHAICTVFSTPLVAPACALGLDAIKSASPDIVHRPLLIEMMRSGLPMIVSTGASTLDEVARAVSWLQPARSRLCLLHCVSAYPALRAQVSAIGTLRDAFPDIPIGYSDHAPAGESGAGVLARRYGACVFERHLTWNRHARGPDHAASDDPAQLTRYIEQIRACEPDPSLTDFADKEVLDSEREVRRLSRQSVVATRDLPAGHVLRESDLTIKRPASGVEPWRLGELPGRRLVRPLRGDMPVAWDDLEQAEDGR